jgi:hypothetical protein
MIIEVKNLSNPSPLSSTPLIQLATTPMVSMLINAWKRPRVKKLIGNVRNFIIGITVKFRRVRKNTNMKAAVIPVTSKFGKRADNPSMVTILAMKYKITLNIVNNFIFYKVEKVSTNCQPKSAICIRKTTEVFDLNLVLYTDLSTLIA